MDPNIPHITVIIPCYNAEAYLQEALDSVFAQQYPSLEVILIDDGSQDGSLALARSYIPEIQVMEQKNQGAAAARNAGISAAKGDYLAFLDADDLWLPGKLTRQMELLEDDPNVDMVFGGIEQFSESGGETSQHPNGLLPSALLVRTRSFMQVGFFNTQWKVGEFIDWYSQAEEKGLITAVIPEIIVRRRIHDSNLGVREKGSQTDYIRILKAALDRKRKKDP